MAVDVNQLGNQEIGHVEGLYSDMVAIPGGADVVGTEATRVLDALRAQGGWTPSLENAVATTRREFAVLGNIIGGGWISNELRTVLRIAEPGLRDRLVADAEMAILQADRNPVAAARHGWVNYLPKRLGESTRQFLRLADEMSGLPVGGLAGLNVGDLRQAWRAGDELPGYQPDTRQGQRVMQRVRADIALITTFPDFTAFEASALANPTSRQAQLFAMLRQEIGRLAPNQVAFQVAGAQGLEAWAGTVNVPASPGAPPGAPVVTVQQAIQSLCGNDSTQTRELAPVMAYLRSTPPPPPPLPFGAPVPPPPMPRLEQLRAVLDERQGGPEVLEAAARLNQLNTIFEHEERRRRAEREAIAQREQNGRRNLDRRESNNTRWKSAADLMRQIGEQESIRHNANESKTGLQTQLAALPPPLNPVPQGMVDTYGATRFRLTDDLARINRELLAAEQQSRVLRAEFRATYAVEITGVFPGESPADVAVLQPIFNSVNAAIPAVNLTSNEAVMLSQRTSELKTNCHTRDQAIRDARQTLTDTIQQDRQALDQTHNDPYNYTVIPPPPGPGGAVDPARPHPDIATLGITSFVQLQEKRNEAQTKHQQVLAQARIRERGQEPLSGHQLLYLLLERDLRDAVPPIALEDRRRRAILGSLMLADLVDSDTDEGMAIRRAQEVSQRATRRILNSDNRETFREFVQGTLIQMDGFEKCGELTLQTTSEDLLRMVQTGQLAEDRIPVLMQAVEQLAQDTIGGRANLELNIQLRGFLDNVKMAWYQLRAQDVLKEVGNGPATDRPERTLRMFGERAPDLIVPPPRADLPAFKFQTRKQREQRERVERTEAEAAAAEEAGDTERAKQLRNLVKRYRSYESPVTAWAAHTAMTLAPYWIASAFQRGFWQPGLRRRDAARRARGELPPPGPPGPPS